MSIDKHSFEDFLNQLDQEILNTPSPILNTNYQTGLGYADLGTSYGGYPTAIPSDIQTDLEDDPLDLEDDTHTTDLIDIVNNNTSVGTVGGSGLNGASIAGLQTGGGQPDFNQGEATNPDVFDSLTEQPTQTDSVGSTGSDGNDDTGMDDYLLREDDVDGMTLSSMDENSNFKE